MKNPPAARPRYPDSRQLLRALGAALFLIPGLGTGQTIFSDNFEAGLTQWSAEGLWGTTTARNRSPVHSVSDSPGTFYTNNSDARLTLAAAVDLTAASRPVLVFHHGHTMEVGYDFGRVEVSTDGGSSWVAEPLAAYTGVLPGMVREQLDLSAHAAATDLKIRFRMVTDYSIVMEGWYLDDVRIANAPESAVLVAPTGSDLETNSVTLRWTAPAEPDFAERRILRMPQGAFDWRAARVVGVIDDPAVLEFTDITVAPKSHYQYAVMTLTTHDTHSLSNLASATTPSGMDYPFLDNGEAGPGFWIATPPWALTDEDFHSPSHAWTDSPGGNYADNISSQPLTLAAPFSLAAAENPALSFWHRYTLASGDVAAVEISTNLGTSWTTLQSITTGSSPWRQVRLPLAAYVGQPSVMIRFRLTTNASANAEGWFIDDVSVAEIPATVSAPAIDEVTSHGLRLTWNADASLPFSHYAIHRSTSPGVGIHSPCIAEIHDQTQTTFTDTELALDTLYYYRIYAVSPYGTYSDDSVNEASVRTLNNPLPFATGFDAENDLLAWNAGADTGANVWGLSETVKRSGASALASSPNASYAANTNTWIETAVDLRGTEWPVLSFWDRFGLNTGDHVRLEISATGGPSIHVYGAYDDSRSEWARQRVDLSPWKGLASVKLRFRLVSDGGATPGDGWFIDDLEVSENPNRNTPLALPFTEDFESGAVGWLLSGWRVTSDDSAVDGIAVLRDGGPGIRKAPDTQSWAVLDRPVVLPTGSNIQATVWLRGNMGRDSNSVLQYSTNAGSTWGNYFSDNGYYGFDTGDSWLRRQSSLAGQAGQTLRLRLATNCDYRAPVVDISFDKFTLAEMPAAVSLVTAVPALRTVDLTWTETALASTFQRYEIWRSTTANVSLTNGTKIHEISDPLATTFTDSGLNIGGTYFYKVFTIDERDTYSPSNELSSTTVPVSIPFADAMDSMDNWVTGSNNANPSTWAVTTDNPHGGTGSLATVEVGQYTPSTDSYIETAVDLRGTEWPVLSFWDRFGLNTGDYVRLEISAAGGSTQHPYGVMEGSRSEWRQQRIDLSPWKGLGNVRLRFRLVSDAAATNGDGWFIDDLEVSENPNRNTPLVLPFTEDFESGAAGWLMSGWSVTSDDSAVDGTAVLRDGGPGARKAPDTQSWAVLDRPVVLPAGSNVQATVWLRGILGRDSNSALQYSTNAGLTWMNYFSDNGYWGFDTGSGWQRRQGSLAGQAGQTLRLRLMTTGDYRAPVVDISLDKFTLAEMPAAVSLVTAVPALRTLDLTWTQTTLGSAFQRYEVWRSTTANVSLTNGTKIFETTDPAVTTFTDSGLNIGGTYFYKVFNIDERDAFSPSNELSGTTVPVSIPFADAMDSMDNWVTGLNNANPSTWAVNTDNPHGGTGSLATVEVGQYTPSTDSYIETAVDLRGTEWPVLSFWDRFGLNSGDWVRLEISAAGGSTQHPYGVMEGSRSEWRQQRIDLSPWKGLGNVRLRFRLVSDAAATNGDGWFIDDLEVSENPNRNTPLVLPFTEDFESGATGWLLSGWSVTADGSAVDGTAVLRDGGPGARKAPDTQSWAVLDRPVVLPAGSNVQATMWLRGILGRDSNSMFQYSTNAGLTWGNYIHDNGYWGFDTGGGWLRRQSSLAGQAGQTLRLRLVTNCDYRAPVVDISFDKFTLAEMPAAVSVLPIDEVDITSMRINWTPSALDRFQRYEIYRSTTSTVTNASTLVATLTDRESAFFTDVNLESRIQYYYRVYLIDDRDTYSPSDVVSATTLGLPLPYAHDFEDGAPGWTFTGQWQVQPEVGREGGAALVDSPGDYAASSDTTARFAVNLNGTDWPVLRYWDRHDFAGNSWGRVEVSINNSSWTVVGGVTATRTSWRMQEIDLSPWKNQVRVFIRFRSGTDGNLADGWTIDDVSIDDRGVESAYPIFEDAENGTGQWIASAWTPVADNPYAGSLALHDTPGRSNPPDTPNQLVYAREIDLTTAVNPTLTYFIRGNLGNYSYFRVEVSTNGGVSWSTIGALNQDSGFNSATWIKKQAPLTAWLGQRIRLRFVSSSDHRMPASNILLDNIGIGEAAPGAPVPLTPGMNETATVIRPTLTVANAVDFQSDAITYQFEVYADAALTQLVSQVPAVAAGVTTTSWQVDADLTDNAPYWWRARASDGADTGPWSEVIGFNLNEFNNPPLPVVVAGPANDSLMLDGNGLLLWYQASDPDPGDVVLDYQIQISSDFAFTTIAVDVPGITVDPSIFGPDQLAAVFLGDLPGGAALPSGRWFWRIRARDQRFSSGPWSQGFAYFRLPTYYQRHLRQIYPDPDWFLHDVSDPNADPDGNGVGVLMEFAMGIAPGEHPGDRLPRPIQVSQQDAAHQGFEWTSRKLHELDYYLQSSTDLRTWSRVPDASMEVLHEVDANTMRVRMVDPLPVGATQRRFVRLAVDD